MTGRWCSWGLGKVAGFWKKFKGNFTLGDQKPNFDAEFGTLPTAPGPAWMMLGKRGARSSFAYMQTRPSQLSRCHLSLEHPAQRLGPAFIYLSTQPWKRAMGLPALPTKLTRTLNHPQHPWAGGAKDLHPQSLNWRCPCLSPLPWTGNAEGMTDNPGFLWWDCTCRRPPPAPASWGSHTTRAIPSPL